MNVFDTYLGATLGLDRLRRCLPHTARWVLRGGAARDSGRTRNCHWYSGRLPLVLSTLCSMRY